MSGACPRLGFRVGIDIRSGVAPPDQRGFLDAWTSFLEGRGLQCGGGGAFRVEYVVTSESSQATDSDRAATEAWLASRREVSGWLVGDLEDLDRAG
jgi:uncharacterized protein YggL (DUF469 family)